MLTLTIAAAVPIIAICGLCAYLAIQSSRGKDVDIVPSRCPTIPSSERSDVLIDIEAKWWHFVLFSLVPMTVLGIMYYFLLQ